MSRANHKADALRRAEVTAVVEVEAVAQPKKLRDRRATAALPSTKSAVEDTPVKERRVRGHS